MSASEKPDPVQPELRRAEAELAKHLEEACEETVDRGNIAEESTDELLRLEEELLAAARAAEKAVRLRRQLGEDKAAVQAESTVREPTTAPLGDAAGTRVREFRTAAGSEWRVWEVRPGLSGRTGKLALYPADYVNGWLAFELLEGERRKRLLKFAPDWWNAPDAYLERLLEQAMDVPKRKQRAASEDAPPGL